MKTKSAAIHRRMLMLVSQLPITGSAHKAGIVCDARLAVVDALLDVPANHCGPTRLDRRHDPTAAGGTKRRRVRHDKRRRGGGRCPPPRARASWRRLNRVASPSG
jgi:hypothetical protein